MAAARDAFADWSGRPWEARVRVFERAADLVRYYAGEMRRSEGYARPLARAFAREETQDVLRPHGVFAVIAPFNFPLALSVNMVSGALLTGNTVVYKPSPMAGLAGALLVEALHEAGVPGGALNLVCGGAEVGRALVDDRAARRFEAASAEAASRGRVALGGRLLSGEPFDRGHYAPPTIATDLPADHRLRREELFLPFLTVQRFARLDEAIAGGNRASGATTGAWPGIQSFAGWKGSGATGKGGLGPYYLPQFMREQSRTIMRRR